MTRASLAAPDATEHVRDAQRYRALVASTRLDTDEEGGPRLVAALPPVPPPAQSALARRVLRLLTGEPRATARALERMTAVRV